MGCTTDSVRTDSLSIGINLANPEGGGGISFSYRWDFRGFGGGIQKTEQLRTPNNLAASELQADTQVAWTTQGLLTDTETFSTTLSTSYANADGPVFSGVNTDISNRSVQSSFLIDMAAVVPIAIQSILFSPAEANPSQQPAVTGTVTLASPAKIDTVITLASNSLNATLLPTVTVPQGDSELHGVFGAGGGGSDCRYSVIERGERWLRAAYKPADVEVPEDRSQLVGQEVGGPRLLLQAQRLSASDTPRNKTGFPALKNSSILASCGTPCTTSRSCLRTSGPFSTVVTRPSAASTSASVTVFKVAAGSDVDGSLGGCACAGLVSWPSQPTSKVLRRSAGSRRFARIPVGSQDSSRSLRPA